MGLLMAYGMAQHKPRLDRITERSVSNWCLMTNTLIMTKTLAECEKSCREAGSHEHPDKDLLRKVRDFHMSFPWLQNISSMVSFSSVPEFLSSDRWRSRRPDHVCTLM